MFESPSALIRCKEGSCSAQLEQNLHGSAFGDFLCTLGACTEIISQSRRKVQESKRHDLSEVLPIKDISFIHLEVYGKVSPFRLQVIKLAKIFKLF